MIVDPIQAIEWRHFSDLRANHYNPNVVFTMELRLLERSILKTGWVQPVLCSADGEIIDGFHRWSLSSKSEALLAKYAGKLPVAVLNVEPWEAMLLTVRMNRAKGTHVATRMQAMVRTLIDEHHVDMAQVAEEIGADIAEVRHLYQGNIYKDRNLKDAPYSKAWVPAETRNEACR